MFTVIIVYRNVTCLTLMSLYPASGAFYSLCILETNQVSDEEQSHKELTLNWRTFRLTTPTTTLYEWVIIGSSKLHGIFNTYGSCKKDVHFLQCCHQYTWIINISSTRQVGVDLVLKCLCEELLMIQMYWLHWKRCTLILHDLAKEMS